MATFKIPGLDYSDESDEDKEVKSKATTQKHFLAIDVSTLSVKLVGAPLSTPNDRLTYNGMSALYIFTEEEYLQLGISLPDEDVEFDDCIHCDLCEQYYVGCCKEHPLYWIPDRSATKEIPAGEERRAEKSKPLFVRIRMSKIVNAGLGAFAEMSIPRGFVFGPYEGVLIEDADHAKVDGYCWEIRSKDKIIFIDGSDPRYSNWMRFINHSDTQNEQNAVAFQYQGSVYYRIMRPVEKGEEILVYYGANYAAELDKDSQSERKAYFAQTPVKRKKSPRNPFIL